jgi:hypothetical protein
VISISPTSDRPDLLGGVPKPGADLICTIQNRKPFFVAREASVGVVSQAHSAESQLWDHRPVVAELPDWDARAWHFVLVGAVEGAVCGADSVLPPSFRRECPAILYKFFDLSTRNACNAIIGT